MSKKRFICKCENNEPTGDCYIYDSVEELDLGVSEATDLLNYLIEENKQLNEQIDRVKSERNYYEALCTEKGLI